MKRIITLLKASQVQRDHTVIAIHVSVEHDGRLLDIAQAELGRETCEQLAQLAEHQIRIIGRRCRR